MRLSLRILALFFTGVLLLLAVDSCFLIRRDMQQLDRGMEQDATHLGRILGELLTRVAAADGPDEAVALVRRLDRADHDLRLRWVWLDEGAAAEHAPRVDPDVLAPVRRGATVSVKRADAGADGLRLTYAPVNLGGSRAGALELSETLAPLRDSRRVIVLRSLAFGLVMAVLGLAMSWLILLPLVGRPLQQMLRKTEAIGAGDFTCDLHLPGRGELSDLSQAMNGMCRQLDLARTTLEAESAAKIAALEQLRHAERLAMLGRIASGLAHELGTPLNVVAGRAKMIGTGELDAGETADSARIIHAQAERMTGIIRQLLDFARRPGGRRQPQRLEGLVGAVLTMLEPTARAAKVVLAQDAAADLPRVSADHNQLQQVLLNLVMNAIQAMPDGGTVRVGLARDDDGDAPGVAVTIADEGVGIDEATMAQIFEPFFTTKPTGQGTGLGLPIVKDIVAEHGGRIAVASEPGRGTTFTLWLPAEVQA